MDLRQTVINSANDLPISGGLFLMHRLLRFAKLTGQVILETFEKFMVDVVDATGITRERSFDGPLSWQWCSLWKTWCKDLTNRLSLNAGSKALELLGPGIDVSSVARFLRSEG